MQMCLIFSLTDSMRSLYMHNHSQSCSKLAGHKYTAKNDAQVKVFCCYIHSTQAVPKKLTHRIRFNDLQTS